MRSTTKRRKIYGLLVLSIIIGAFAYLFPGIEVSHDTIAKTEALDSTPLSIPLVDQQIADHKEPFVESTTEPRSIKASTTENFSGTASQVEEDQPDKQELMEKAKGWLLNDGTSFVANKGQIIDSEGNPRPEILYSMTDSRGIKLYLTRSRISYVFTELERAESDAKDGTGLKGTDTEPRAKAHRVDVEFVGSNKNTNVVAYDKQDGVQNYYTGSAPEGILDVPSFKKLVYENIYSSIDLVLYGKESGFKYDFVVRPGGDPSNIRVKYTGPEDLDITQGGDLKITTSLGYIQESKPVSFIQSGDGKSLMKVQSEYSLSENILTFNIESYDVDKTLVIDPDVYWATYVGNAQNDKVCDVYADALNRVAVTGVTSSMLFPVTAGGTMYNMAADAFVIKYRSDGSKMWATCYGGSLNDTAYGVVTGDNSHVYVTGVTFSPDLPPAPPAKYGQAFNLGTGSGSSDAFVAKFAGSNGVLIWGEFLGGQLEDVGTGITWSGNAAIVCGYTRATLMAIDGVPNSVQFPTTPGVLQPLHKGGYDAFIAGFRPSPAPALYWFGTEYGGTHNDYATDIAYDCTGNIVISGYTDSHDLPMTNLGAFPIHIAPFPDFDAFVLKCNNNVAVAHWATYYGGNGNDLGWGIAVDRSCDIVMVGQTASFNLPLGGQNVFQGLYGGSNDIFAIKLRASGGPASMVWATYYGGSGREEAYDVIVDRDDYVWITGLSQSTTFPVTVNGFQTNPSGSKTDAFLLNFTDNGERVTAFLYGGKNDDDQANGITVDIDNNIIIGGETGGWSSVSDFPELKADLSRSDPGLEKGGFVAKFNTVSFMSYAGGNGDDIISAINQDVNGDVVATGMTWSSDFPRNVGQSSLAGSADAFVIKYENSGKRIWSTYHGGSSSDVGLGIDSDKSGRINVVGYTTSSDLPVASAHQFLYGGNGDAFITQFSSGGVLNWSTYYGDGYPQSGNDIVVDGNSNIILAGETDMGPPQNKNDALVVKFNATGVYQWQYVIGDGVQDDQAFGVAVDASNAVIFVGVTGGSSAFTGVTGCVQQFYGGGDSDGFVCKLSPSGSLLWKQYCGGSSNDALFDVVINSQGDIIAVGHTGSTDFPTVSPIQSTLNNNPSITDKVDGVIVIWNGNGTSAHMSTYLGAEDYDAILGVDVDLNDGVSVIGVTRSYYLSVENAIQPNLSGGTDGFVLKLSKNGAGYLKSWLTYIGGSDYDNQYQGFLAVNLKAGIVLDESGSAIIGGGTYSYDFPVGTNVDKPVITNSFESDGYIAKIEVQDYSVRKKFPTYYGGCSEDQAKGVIVDGAGSVIVAGVTYSLNFPTTAGAIDKGLFGLSDGFVAKFTEGGELRWSTYIGGNGKDVLNGVDVDSRSNIVVGGFSQSSNYPTTIGVHQRTYGGSTDGVITKISPGGTLTWSTYYGGSGPDYVGGSLSYGGSYSNIGEWSDGAGGIAVDRNDDKIIVVGSTLSVAGIATAGTLQPGPDPSIYSSIEEGFIAKFSAAGLRDWGTYFGGNGIDRVRDVTMDDNGMIWITGYTASTGLGHLSGSSYAGGAFDAFAASLSQSGAISNWGVYYGTAGDDKGFGIACDGNDNLLVVGQSNSAGLPGTGTFGGGIDGFVVKFNNSGVLQWALYTQGSASEGCIGVSTNSSNDVLVAGWTASSNLPGTSAGVLQQTHGGNDDGFVMKFNSSGTNQWTSYYGGSGDDHCYAVASSNVDEVIAVGVTTSSDLIIDGDAFQEERAATFMGIPPFGTNNPLADAFVARLKDNGAVAPIAPPREHPRQQVDFAEEFDRGIGTTLGTVSSTAVAGAQASGGITAQPNPSLNQVIVEVSGEWINSDGNELAVMDILGRRISGIGVLRVGPAQWRLDVSSLSPGIYIVRVTSGDESRQVKIMKMN